MIKLFNDMLVNDCLSRVSMVVYSQSASIIIQTFHGIFQFVISMSNKQSIYQGIKYIHSNKLQLSKASIP